MNPSHIGAALAALALALAAAAHADPVPVLAQPFDDFGTLVDDWHLVNHSTPPGLAWFHGNDGVFEAQAGGPATYIAASYLSAQGGAGTVDNWLIMPYLNAVAGNVHQLSFHTRAADDPGQVFDNRLEVLWGAGTSVDSANFTSLLLAVDAGYPQSWTEYQTLSPSGGGRFAFRYVGDAASADYIGLDSIAVGYVPEPAGSLMLALGLGTLALLRRAAHARGLLCAGMAAATLAMPAAADTGQQGMIIVRDPVSGQLRAPTAAEFQELQRQAARVRASADKGAADPALQVTHKPDGTQRVLLRDKGMVYSVVTRDARGTLQRQCVDAAGAAAALERPATGERDHGHD